MATLPIYLTVEDVAVGPLLVKLRDMPGIIKIDLKFLEPRQPKQISAAGPSSRPHSSGGPNVQQQVIALLLKHGTLHIRQICEAVGGKKSRGYGAVHQLRKAGVVVSGASAGTWRLSDKARKEMPIEGDAAEILKLPKPRAEAAALAKTPAGRLVKGQGQVILIAAIAGGLTGRADIGKYLVDHGVPSKAVRPYFERAKKNSLIRRTDSGAPTQPGTYALTAAGRKLAEQQAKP